MQENLPLPLRHKLVRDTLPGAEDTRAHTNIGMHGDRLPLLVLPRMPLHTLHHPHQRISLHLVRELARLVRRLQSPHVGLRPDLQEVAVFVLVAVVLGVADAGSRGSELDFAAAQVLEVAHRVFVLELAVDDVRPDEELGVRVRAEARAALDAVFVYHAQGAEVFVFGVVVAGEGEGVEGVEPTCKTLLVCWFGMGLEFLSKLTMISVTSAIPGAFLDLEVGC
jgi:hypothetical protein